VFPLSPPSKPEGITMTKEKDVVSSIVEKLINNGAMDEIVLAVLESSLETNFEELEKLSNRKYLEAHHWQDYADCLQYAHACLKVLRHFSVSNYEEEQVRANRYSIKIEELY
jgi:hypothetical protein